LIREVLVERGVDVYAQVKNISYQMIKTFRKSTANG